MRRRVALWPWLLTSLVACDPPAPPASPQARMQPGTGLRQRQRASLGIRLSGGAEAATMDRGIVSQDYDFLTFRAAVQGRNRTLTLLRQQLGLLLIALLIGVWVTKANDFLLAHRRADGETMTWLVRAVGSSIFGHAHQRVRQLWVAVVTSVHSAWLTYAVRSSLLGQFCQGLRRFWIELLALVHSHREIAALVAGLILGCLSLWTTLRQDDDWTADSVLILDPAGAPDGSHPSSYAVGRKARRATQLSERVFDQSEVLGEGLSLHEEADRVAADDDLAAADVLVDGESEGLQDRLSPAAQTSSVDADVSILSAAEEAADAATERSNNHGMVGTGLEQPKMLKSEATKTQQEQISPGLKVAEEASAADVTIQIVEELGEALAAEQVVSIQRLGKCNTAVEQPCSTGMPMDEALPATFEQVQADIFSKFTRDMAGKDHQRWSLAVDYATLRAQLEEAGISLETLQPCKVGVTDDDDDDDDIYS